MVVAPVAAVAPMAAMMVAVAPAVMMVAPMAAMVTPVSVMVVAMPPVPGMMAVAEMMVVPLHRFDRRLRRKARGWSRRQRGGVGAEEAASHQREGGERETGVTFRGWFRHRVTSVHRAVQGGLESEAKSRRMNAY